MKFRRLLPLFIYMISFFLPIIVITIISLTTGVNYDNVDIVYDVNKDGSAIVTETYDVNYKEEKANFYKNYKFKTTLDDEYGGDDITILGATIDGKECTKFPREISHEEFSDYLDNPEYSSLPVPYNFYEYKSGTSKEIGVWFPREKGKREITLKYKIDNFVVGYNDTAVIYTKLIHEDSPKVKKINAVINLPGDVEKAWLHHRDGSEIKKSFIDVQNLSKIKLTGEGNKAGNYFETRMIIPKSVFASFGKEIDEDKKDFIIAEETKWYNAYQEVLNKKNMFAIIDIVATIAVLAVCVIVSILIVLKTRPHNVKEYPYFRDMPEGLDTANVAYLFYYHNGALHKDKQLNNAIAGTVLDFVRRGILKMDGEGNFEIIADSDISALSTPELEVYNILKTTADTTGSLGVFRMEDIEKQCTNRSEALTIKSSFRRYVAYSGIIQGSSVVEKAPAIKKLAPVIASFSIIGAFFLLFFMFGYLSFTIAALVINCIVISIFNGLRETRLTPEGEEYKQQVLGLYRYLDDCSLLNEHDINQLLIWEQYMVYATIMGISEKVLDFLKVKCPEFFEYNENSGYGHCSYFHYYYSPYYRRNGFVTYSISKSFSNLSNTARVLSMPKPSGGGFGGSGGGFSGGGGGGGGSFGSR